MVQHRSNERKLLSFHTVSFGPRNKILHHIAQVTREAEATAPKDPLLPRWGVLEFTRTTPSLNRLLIIYIRAFVQGLFEETVGG